MVPIPTVRRATANPVLGKAEGPKSFTAEMPLCRRTLWLYLPSIFDAIRQTEYEGYPRIKCPESITALRAPKKMKKANFSFHLTFSGIKGFNFSNSITV